MSEYLQQDQLLIHLHAHLHGISPIPTEWLIYVVTTEVCRTAIFDFGYTENIEYDRFIVGFGCRDSKKNIESQCLMIKHYSLDIYMIVSYFIIYLFYVFIN